MKTKTITIKSIKQLALLFLMLLLNQMTQAETWYQINAGTQKKINTICFPSATIGYLAGNDSLLMKSTDGGATWSSINYSGINFYPGGEHILNLQFLNDSVGFATVGPYSGSYGTTDGGLTWSLIGLPGNQCYNQGLFFFDENNGFIGGSGCFQGELISYTSSSPWLTGTWTPSVLSSPSFDPSHIITDIQFYNSNFGLAASKSGYIYRSTNGGQSWDSVATPAPLYPITSVEIINDTLAYAGYEGTGTGFGLYVTTDAGLTWTFDMNSATFYYPDFYTLHETGNATLYTAGYTANMMHGLIFSSSGNFMQWNFDMVDQRINDVASYNDTMVFAVGDSGYIVVNHPLNITGLSQMIQTKFVQIFPNPARGILHINAASFNTNNIASYSIYTLSGAQVKSGQLSPSIAIDDLKPGIYFIEINQQNLREQYKFIVN